MLLHIKTIKWLQVSISAVEQFRYSYVRQGKTMYFLRLWKNVHYSSTTNAILLLTLNLCVYFIYFIAVNTLGGNFFLICRNWPDDLLSFARRGELSRDWRGVSPLHTPPGVSALIRLLSVCNAVEFTQSHRPEEEIY